MPFCFTAGGFGGGYATLAWTHRPLAMLGSVEDRDQWETIAHSTDRLIEPGRHHIVTRPASSPVLRSFLTSSQRSHRATTRSAATSDRLKGKGKRERSP
ncbi:hypothetical protein [Leptolyngbya ohadii]|uniref:hypothetical protein n=1 Tax=Leptolyngbya ohadii TaxID=1962290 RepID=UPI001179E153|nr:hypothetical protein [Leptolyngbya ohadii]